MADEKSTEFQIIISLRKHTSEIVGIEDDFAEIARGFDNKLSAFLQDMRKQYPEFDIEAKADF